MSLTRIGSIGINTGIAFAGVTTIVTLNTANDALSIGATVNVGSGITLGASGDIFATGVSTVTTLKVGSGVTVSSDGDIFATGVCTATSFSGTIEVSSDTSPQLGGNLDVNTKNILFGDSSDGSSDDVLKFGAGSDLNIYHNGTHSFIKNDNGTLVLNSDAISLTNNAGNSNRITSHSGGEVKLYYSDSVKLQTSSTGVSITGVLDLSSHLDMGDSDVIKLGDGDDLQIYHSGSLNLIDVYTNDLQIRNGASEKMAVFIRNGAVELYNDNVKRFETDSNGVRLVAPEGERAELRIIGDEGDDNNDYFKLSAGEGTLKLQDASNGSSWEDNIVINAAGSVELYYDNSKRLETTSGGLYSVKSGQNDFVVGSSNAGGVYLILDGDSNGDASGSDYSFIAHNTSGDLLIAANNPAGNGDIKFYVGAATLKARFDDSGNLRPETNNDIDLGNSNKRWKNIYTMDLQLSNKDGANDVDGTWGDYTIQEGESDLFLINNRSGKKYKFNLTEVS